MRILFISDFLPHLRADSAGVLDAAMLLKSLCEDHEVDLVSNVARRDEKYLGDVSRICRSVTAIKNQTFDHRFFYIVKTFLSFLSSRPAIMFMARSRKMSRAIKVHLNDNEYDLALVEFTQMVQYLPMIHRIDATVRTVVDESDVAFVRRGRYLENNFRGPVKAMMRMDTSKLRRKEVAYLKSADGILVRTENDLETLKSNGLPVNPSRFHVFRPFVNFDHVAHLGRDLPSEVAVLFFAAMWRPVNEEGALYFLDQILPAIKTRVRQLKTYIVGSRPTPKILKYSSSDVDITGFVEDVGVYYRRAKVVVVPVLSGSGIKGKVVQAVGSGRPVVTTSVGAEGTGLTEDDFVYVRDNPEAFADTVAELLDRNFDEDIFRVQDRVLSAFDWKNNYSNTRDYLRRVAEELK